jgi:ParB family chromosome partitioning protein
MDVSIQEIKQTSLFDPNEVVTTLKMKRTGGTPAALQMSESNEWYTPPEYLEAARSVMGEIDLDPASNPIANRIVRARTYFDIHSNGLTHNWPGRVWLNPPYGRDNGDSNQEIWSYRLISQFQASITTEAVLLVNAVTDRKWFQPLWDYTICFTNHRIKFYSPDIESVSPTHGNVLVYFGPNVSKFIETFKKFGPIVRRIDG